MMKNTKLAIGVLLIVIGVGSFFVGMKYQQSKRPSGLNMQSAGMHSEVAGQQNSMEAQHRGSSGMIYGEIISKDEESITVKQADDSTRIILLSESTEIQKASESSIDDLETSEQVMIFGQENPDGSISAQNIQLNPVFRNRQ